MLTAGPLPPSPGAWVQYGLGISLNPWMIAGLGCYAISIVVWMSVLSKVEVSAAYPLTSMGFVLAAALGFFFLGEQISLQRGLGIALICAGLVFLTRS
jgi:multidrug transporter EmrE-like cation transporter